MENNETLKELRKDFIQKLVKKGYSPGVASDDWDTIIKTYEEYISIYTLPGGLNKFNAMDFFQYLRENGIINELTEKALRKIERQREATSINITLQK